MFFAWFCLAAGLIASYEHETYWNLPAELTYGLEQGRRNSFLLLGILQLFKGSSALQSQFVALEKGLRTTATWSIIWYDIILQCWEMVVFQDQDLRAMIARVDWGFTMGDLTNFSKAIDLATASLLWGTLRAASLVMSASIFFRMQMTCVATHCIWKCSWKGQNVGKEVGLILD